MGPFIGEFIGTMSLIILGDGVVANVILNKTKGFGGGLMSITFGWGMAVFTGVFMAAKLGSGGHLNPAVTLAMVYLGNLDSALAFTYISAQMLGAFVGAVIVWFAYRQHFNATDDADTKLGVFCTSASIKSPVDNIVAEVVGTFVLILGALLMSKPDMKLGTLDALPVALLVIGIGLSLGGPTGYAINPARDLAPRFAHFILPIKGKRDSDWGYSWIPVVGPVIGAIVAAIVFKAIS
ncbi:MAG: aquaporin family protein [Chitinophagaceae bacterium]|nr:MAG: aquaporin family protein [Chitinophagaceae bacterium]